MDVIIVTGKMVGIGIKSMQKQGSTSSSSFESVPPPSGSIVPGPLAHESTERWLGSVVWKIPIDMNRCRTMDQDFEQSSWEDDF